MTQLTTKYPRFARIYYKCREATQRYSLLIKKLLICICLGFGIWSLGFPSHGATWLDPSLKWKTIETPHFSINYYPKIESTAKKMVPIVEEVYDRLTPLLKHIPDLKTNVVLLDITDYTNGFTTVIPSPNVTIYLTDGGSNIRPVAYETWLKYVFLHEYTHVLHLDTVEGAPAYMKMLLGRISFPNGILPTFAIEGMATYFETKHGYGGGRGTDPRWQAMMRMDVLENDIKSIDQAAVNTVRWPDGSLRYLYGVMFFQYLCDNYGEDKLVQFSHLYGDYLLTYGEGIEGCFQAIYGKNLWFLWNEWISDMKDKYQQQKAQIEKDGLTNIKPLTTRGFNIFKPKWGPDSDHIYYNQNNEDEYPSIRRINSLTLNDEKITEGFFYDDSLSIAGGKLYFTKGDTYKNYYTFKDLYSYDLKNKKIVRLTEGLRASDPAVSPDGQKIVYVNNDQGTRTLWLWDKALNNQKMLGSLEADMQYLSPVFSPDGTNVAVAKWTYGGHQSIYLVDINTGKESKLIEYGLSANPSFSPDGEYVLFDSDAAGIVNIYAFNLNTKKLYRLTNVLGMALMPDVSPDGKKIAFINYSSKGYDIGLIDYDRKNWKEIANNWVPSLPEKPVEKKEELTGIISPAFKNVKAATLETEVHDYNPFPTFFPKFWLPYSYTDENGPHTLIYTAAMDSLNQHYAEAQLGYDWNVHRPTYIFNYIDNQFLPQISVTGYDAAVPRNWDNGAHTYWERDKGGGVYFSFFNNRVFHEYDKQVFTVGYSFENLNNISSLEILSVQPSRGNINGALLAWRYYSLRSYGNSIAPEDGIDVQLKGTLYSKDLGGDYNFNYYSFSLSNYLALFSHHVLASKAVAAVYKGEKIAQGGFTSGNLGIRGYSSLTGTKLVKETIEYDFPLSILETGTGYGLTFFDRFWGNFFFEFGGVTSGTVGSLSLVRSIGAELALNTINGYGYVPMVLKIGYAKGIDAGGSDQLYFYAAPN